MTSDLNVILLIDRLSRKPIKVNPASLNYYNVSMISDLSEITQELIDKTNKVVILSEALKIPGMLSCLRLYKELFNLEYYFLSDEAVYLSLMSEYAHCYKMNIANLDHDMLQAVLYNDTTLVEKYTSQINVSTKGMVKAKEILASKQMPQDIHNLAEEYVELIGTLETLLQTNDSLRQLYHESNINVERLEQEVRLSTEFVADLIKKCNKFTMDTRQFESLWSKDIYSKVHLSEYPNKPIVVYMKQYEELDDLDMLLYWLYHMFTLQLRVPTKIVKLYDNVECKRLKVQPQSFTVLGNSFNLSTITSNNYLETGNPAKSDLLVKFGGYQRLLDALLTNKEGKGLLIIVDCKIKEDIVVIGPTLQYSLCRNANHKVAYGLGDNTICNNGDGPLVWDVKELPPMAGRYIHEVLPDISCLPIMSRLYQDVQRYITH